jgi:hypothetical protein
MVPSSTLDLAALLSPAGRFRGKRVRLRKELVTP